jgi:hypothetical protein
MGCRDTELTDAGAVALAALLALGLPSCGVDNRQFGAGGSASELNAGSQSPPATQSTTGSQAEAHEEEVPSGGSVDVSGAIAPRENDEAPAEPGTARDAGVTSTPPGSACAVGSHRCGTECVSDTDVASCGVACQPCPLPEGATATCDGTRCGVECAPDYFAHEGACDIDAIDVAVGLNHNCAVLRDSSVRCWGLNSDGQLGDGTAAEAISATAVTVRGLTGARAVRNGSSHSCALMSDGSVQCWGENTSGQLGIGSLSAGSFTPVPVSGLTGALQLSAAGRYTCAILADGTLRCWGSLEQIDVTPVIIPVSGTPTQVAVGNAGGCALLSTGNVECWGLIASAGVGSLGVTAIFATVPVDIGVTGGRLVAVGSDHICVWRGDDDVQCLGANDAGQLGTGALAGAVTTPQAVVGLDIDAVDALRVIGNHTCLLAFRGGVWCWGGIIEGQMGGSVTPVLVALPGPAVALATGIENCAVVSDGSVWCWRIGSSTAVQIPGW